MAVCVGVLLIEEERLLLDVFGSKRELEAGDWRNLHEEELYDWHVSPKID